MVVLCPIATTAGQAVTKPFGYAPRAEAARTIASEALLAVRTEPLTAELRGRYHRAVRIEHVSAWAPGRWKTLAGTQRRWQKAIDDHWGEALALTDGTWRLGISYYQVRPPLMADLKTDKEKIAERVARPIGPNQPISQDTADFGLFAQLLTGQSPDALRLGQFEIPDPLNPGHTITDE